MPTDQPVSLGIIRVSLMKYFIDETYASRIANVQVNFQISQNTHFNVLKEFANLQIGFNFSYPEEKKPFVEIIVLTSFQTKGLLELQELQNHEIDPKELTIPRNLLITCLSIAITNTRSMLIQHLGNTVLRGKLPMLIIDPKEVANVVYPLREDDKYLADQFGGPNLSNG